MAMSHLHLRKLSTFASRPDGGAHFEAGSDDDDGADDGDSSAGMASRACSMPDTSGVCRVSLSSAHFVCLEAWHSVTKHIPSTVF